MARFNSSCAGDDGGLPPSRHRHPKAGIQRLRVAPSLFGSHAVTRGLRKKPDRSTDPLLACGVLNSVGTNPAYLGRSRCASSSALPRTDRYATRWVPASAGMTIGAGLDVRTHAKLRDAPPTMGVRFKVLRTSDDGGSLPIRHSRESGNPARGVSISPGKCR